MVNEEYDIPEETTTALRRGRALRRPKPTEIGGDHDHDGRALAGGRLASLPPEANGGPPSGRWRTNTFDDGAANGEDDNEKMPCQ